jgi:hypothetical protein
MNAKKADMDTTTLDTKHFISTHSKLENSHALCSALAACFLSMPFADHGKCITGMRKKLFDVSAIPAKALYHARNAAKRPKYPPPLINVPLGAPEPL